MLRLRSFFDLGNNVKTPTHLNGLILFGLAWLLGMLLLIPVDYEWTILLRQHRIAWFDRWMAQSLFEGEPLGGGDPVIFLLIFVVIAYFMAWKKDTSSRILAWRPHLGFFLVSMLTISVMMVHGLKWVVGRARPSYVLKGLLPYSDWFEFGPHFITEGTYRGSLPSGHTAQVFILMTLAYVLLLAPIKFKHQRFIGWVWGGASLIYTILMGLSRCMHLSHWISDVVFATGISWILMHLIYYHLLRVPQQDVYLERYGQFPALPRAWEIQLCFTLFGAVVGGMGFILGIRALVLGSGWLLQVSLLSAGALIAAYFTYKSNQFIARVRSAFGHAPTQQG